MEREDFEEDKGLILGSQDLQYLKNKQRKGSKMGSKIGSRAER